MCGPPTPPSSVPAKPSSAIVWCVYGEASSARGDLMGFVRWEALLRALYTGRPIYDESRVALRDPRGAPLDPAPGFRLDDDPREIAHFLREANGHCG